VLAAVIIVVLFSAVPAIAHWLHRRRGGSAGQATPGATETAVD